MFKPLLRLKKVIKNDRGATLVELILTASFLPIAMALAYFVLNQALTTWSFADHKAEALGSARYLIDRMGKDLRQAERPFLSVDTTNNDFIIFKADVNSDPNEDSEIISYSLKPLDSGDPGALANGEQIVRSEYDPTFAGDDPDHLHPIYPNTPTKEETMSQIVRNDKVTPKIPLFTFKKADGADFVSGDDIKDIKMIVVDVYIRSVTAADNETVRVSNSVRLRNF